MLDQEFQYFIDHQNELVKKYNNKHIVIKVDKVIGAYNTLAEAYNETIKTHELGTFLIQECIKGEEAYTQTFHSRVSFS